MTYCGELRLAEHSGRICEGNVDRIQELCF